jgi:hypothetical protein
MYCPAPDEHFFINMFLYVVRINSNEIINHPITFVDWSNNSKHPVSFNTIVKDVVELCRKNKIFFARKFVHMPLSSRDIDCLLQLEQKQDVYKEEALKDEKPIEQLNVFSNAFTSSTEVDLSTITSEFIVNNQPVIVPDAYTNVLDVLNNLDNPVYENIETTSTTSTTTTTTTTSKTTTTTEIQVTDRQKKAVLDFFTDIIDNLSPKKIQTIYSALFDGEPPEQLLPKYNPLDILTMAVETIESGSLNLAPQ